MTKGAVTVGDVERFRGAVSRSLGLSFDDSKLGFLGEVLERRLAATREGWSAYSKRLEPGVLRDELGELARELTVPETYFFRHFAQFRAFAEVALPHGLTQRGPLEKLAILCAGCASGEEAYSLAMVAAERFRELRGRIVIDAVDVNSKALERAARARYGSWALRETPDELRRRWFAMDGAEFVVDDGARACVSFKRLNLVELRPGVLPDAAYDVVFLRNVIMYFTPEAARSVVEQVTRSLRPGGYLFLGHAETLRGISQDYQLCHTHEAFYYRRRGAKEHDHTFEVARQGAPEAPWPLASEAPKSWLETLQRASQRIEAKARSRPEPAAPPPMTNALHKAFELLESERFGDALALLDEPLVRAARDPDVLLLRASLLAHRGELLLAESACTELLAVDDLSAGAHYVLALCREGRGDLASAAEHDRIATYLDDGFAMPRLHLGLMARRAGDRDAARRELERAAKLLEREKPSRLLLFGGGFGREGLIRLCRGELLRLGGAS